MKKILILYFVFIGCNYKESALENYNNRKMNILNIDSLMRAKHEIAISIVSDTTFDVVISWKENEIKKYYNIRNTSLDSIILNEKFKNSNWSKEDVEGLISELKNANCIGVDRIISENWDYVSIDYDRKFMRGDNYVIFREVPDTGISIRFKKYSLCLAFEQIDGKVYWEVIGK